MRISVIIFGIIIFISCKSKEVSDEIIIQGDVKGIPDGKVYLTEAHYWMINLDSTTVKDGKFVFKVIPDSNFYPYEASIKFPDSNSIFKISGLTFANNHSEAFYLEKGITIITSDTAKPFRAPSGSLFISANVKAGKQNDAYRENQMSDFGWLGNLDSIKRNSRIRYFKSQIKKYPFSFSLLESVFNARGQYSKDEWNDILVLFDRDIQNSALGNKVKKYLANRRDPNSPYLNLALMNSEKKRANIISDNSQLNMLVFWASWCGPCRTEIPALKRLHTKYKDRNLNLSSISVDENEKDWRNAMQKENMSWPQFIVEKKEKEIVDAQFDPSAIPLIIFTDKTGKQIAKFIGYEKGQESRYDSIISLYLNKN